MAEPRSFLSDRVRVKTGDITREEVDAIVNAANSSLMGGGGVDGAIHRAGGPAVLEACRETRQTERPDGLPTGEAVITTAGAMPAQYVIHTVGPVWRGGKSREPELLANCYRNSLALAGRHSLKTIAFPAISTGVYGYPREAAAQVASQAIEAFLEGDSPLGQVRLVFFREDDAQVFLGHCVWA